MQAAYLNNTMNRIGWAKWFWRVAEEEIARRKSLHTLRASFDQDDLSFAEDGTRSHNRTQVFFWRF